MEATTLLAGIGAVITSGAGLALIVREFRNREHKASRSIINHLTSDLYRVEAAYVDLRHYCYVLRQRIADRGEEVPTAPMIHELQPDE